MAGGGGRAVRDVFFLKNGWNSTCHAKMTTYSFWASLNNTIFGPHLLISYEQRSFHSLVSTLQDKICDFDFRASVTQNLGLLNEIKYYICFFGILYFTEDLYTHVPEL